MDIQYHFKKRMTFFCISFCLIWVMLINMAYAGYNFDKIRIVLSPSQPVDTIRLSNPEKDQAINLQIRTVKWTQIDGQDNYSPTTDLIIAPPVMKILPGKTQITRVGWRAPQAINQELSYRMIIQDLTPYKKLENTIRFKLEANMPVFIKPTNPIFQAQWKVQRAGNTLTIINRNTGNIHIQVTKITLTNANSDIVASLVKGYYVLPQQTITSNLQIIKSPGSTVTITAETDNGKLISSVPVS